MVDKSRSSRMSESQWFAVNAPLRNSVEVEFVQTLRRRAVDWRAYGVQEKDTQVWIHESEGIGAWLLVSLDLVKDNVVERTLRLDFDGTGIAGGWSPSALNWDDGVPATEAGIDVQEPDGILVRSRAGSPVALGSLAGDWFEKHLRTRAGLL